MGKEDSSGFKTHLQKNQLDKLSQNKPIRASVEKTNKEWGHGSADTGATPLGQTTRSETHKEGADTRAGKGVEPAGRGGCSCSKTHTPDELL